MISKDIFGRTKTGSCVERYTFQNKNGVKVQVINFGAIITSICVPDKRGIVGEITYGYNTLAEYEDDQSYFGAIVGRVCGRIANSSFELNGKQYRLSTNCGRHHIHGGHVAFSKALWTASVNDNRVTMNLLSKDGEEGYPGELTTSVIFELTEDNEFCIETSSSTNQNTPVNITYHPYFNLDLKNEEHIYAHVVSIKADKYVVTDKEVIPTGQISSVRGTLYDLQTPVVLANHVPFVSNGIGYDTCYCLIKDESIGDNKQLAARVEHPESGRYIEVRTTKPGLNFYNSYYAHGLTERDGHVIRLHGALCLETQHYPDSVHHESFPSVIITPENSYRHSCSYQFGII